MSTDLSTDIASYISRQRDGKLEAHDRKVANATGIEIDELAAHRLVLIERYVPGAWLESAARRAYQIRVSTHAPKFAHPGVRGGGIQAMLEPSPRPTEIATYTLESIQMDIDGGAAALDVGSLLLIARGGDALWSQIANDDPVSIDRFSSDPDQTRRWLDGLSCAIAAFSGQSHALARQVYFPVSDGYHLLSPQFATSLAHAIHARVQASKFSEDAVEARKCRAAGEPCLTDHVVFPLTARIKYGGSQPQNVSLLNTRRGGVAFLMNASPPTWESRLKLSSTDDAPLWRMYASRSGRTFQTLRSFLSGLGSSNNVFIRRRRRDLVAELVDIFLQLVVELRGSERPGWSRGTNLPLAEQCLLDPGRATVPAPAADGDGVLDESFAQALEDGAWRDTICADFGAYLNHRLEGMHDRKGRRLQDLAEGEAQAWSSALRKEIRHLNDDLEVLP